MSGSRNVGIPGGVIRQASPSLAMTVDWKTDRLDFVYASLIALLTLLSRIPYRARILYDWDSVQFALALREYDVVKHQPHPPGYILYVALGRLVNAWLDDPTTSYAVLSMTFSALATFITYYLARQLYDRTTALMAAVLLSSSPMFWFLGSVATSYVAEAFFAAAIAYLSYRALNGSEWGSWLGAATLGLAGGLRGLMEIKLPSGRSLYMVLLHQKLLEHGGYTFIVGGQLQSVVRRSQP